MSLVVVTGASGHIGANLVKQLLADGRSVRALYHRSKGLLEDESIDWVQGDVRDKDTLLNAFKGAETVFHLAAMISIEGDLDGLVNAVNVEGARNVAQACLTCGVKRLVHFSSIHAFNQSPLNEVLDETRARATGQHHNAYDRSKAAGEAKVREVIAQGLDCVFVHPSGVIGPFDGEPSRMGQVFLDLYHGALPALIDGGFDWVDVRDVVSGAVAAETQGRCGENYLLTGKWRSVKDLADIAAGITGKKRPTMVTPMWLARGWAPFQAALDRMRGKRPLYTSESLEALRANKQVDHGKAERELGHAPRPIEESIKDIYAWFEKVGKLS